MNRMLSLSLLLSAAVLASACTNDDAVEAPAEDAAPVAAAPAADAPPADVPPPEDMVPPELPEPVIDSTPVDTVITRIDGSDEASDTELTGALADTFEPLDSVFLDVRTSGTAGTYTISSRWFYPDGTVITENSQIVNSAGPASTIFSMSKPDGWAPGTYKVEFSINGKLQQTKEFVVR